MNTVLLYTKKITYISAYCKLTYTITPCLQDVPHYVLLAWGMIHERNNTYFTIFSFLSIHIPYITHQCMINCHV